ncbi:Holliday junction branch migration protein RuvA [Tetragenococcus solitarius]|uniref:Holliday junction branch migration complex subunit RuvA n=1 Tax=Tetragenococcus solitarius TaxID=71453 RepID=A0ABN3Y3B3_9ENTE|nr:Holliday junction branch migration protein RuvA [Tetragenococcus solitarius]
MYEYIIGKLTEIHPAYIVVENNGIGYRIAAGNPYQYSSQVNQKVKIFVHQVIREDAHTLYGFNTLEEKNLFLRLISVSGIGPKSGLAIMANEDHEGLITAIESSNITFLTKFPGVGKKTAQQLILDLQGKLGELPAENQTAVQASADNPALEESMEALQALGYTDKEIKKVYKVLTQEEAMTTDEYLRMALKVMMKK